MEPGIACCACGCTAAVAGAGAEVAGDRKYCDKAAAKTPMGSPDNVPPVTAVWAGGSALVEARLGADTDAVVV